MSTLNSALAIASTPEAEFIQTSKLDPEKARDASLRCALNEPSTWSEATQSLFLLPSLNSRRMPFLLKSAINWQSQT
ncbi:hypothetical protein [Cylindrospermum stagnale]|uniref:hypothetical protein n=1 Tax=Cylindrospermum stagnale TaxID=142864 RepID=UPI0002F10CDB|nr:hypothetical protein [Cylindrospermum stagnale]